MGLSIDFEDPKIKDTASLLVGKVNNGEITSICFSQDNNLKASYGAVSNDKINRVLTAAKDTYSCGNISFTIYTPHLSIPDPKKYPIDDIHCIPGILMDVTVDNTSNDKDITAFFGINLNDSKRAYSHSDDSVHVLRHKDSWEFCAINTPGSYMLRGIDTIKQLENNQSVLHQNGASFICLNVPTGEIGTITVSWSVYTTTGSNGEIETDYYYSRIFNDLRQVSLTMHKYADEIRSKASAINAEYGDNTLRKELFYQGLRGYYASSQLLIDKNNEIHWSIAEGGYLWRNTMDLCADHIAWELKHNPWVVRSLMDDFINYYTYTDQVTFSSYPGTYPGGISFTHDMGCYFTYSKKGYSAYERENDTKDGFYFYMTIEELLNGIYCICSYVLTTKDTEWLKQYPTLLDDLMTSLENRDAPTEADRNGILKAQTLRGGKCNLESTTYDALDHSLLDASGNIYIFIKTWCALTMLEKCSELVGNVDVLNRAKDMHSKCISSSSLFENDENSWLKANAYKDIPGAVIAAIEPLAIPYTLGILNINTEPSLIELTKKHLAACMQKGVCIDSVSGNLRLSSTSTNTWPSKSVLTVFVANKVLDTEIPQSIVEGIIDWAQVSASKTTISDQINSETLEVVGAPYYPRIVTAYLWI